MTKHNKPKSPVRPRPVGWGATAGYVAQEVAKALLRQKHDADVIARFDCYMLSSVMQFAIESHRDANDVLTALNTYMHSVYTFYCHQASRVEAAAVSALVDRRLAHKFVSNKFVCAAFDLFFAHETKVHTPIPSFLYKIAFPRPRLVVERGFSDAGARIYVFSEQKSVQ